MTFEMTAWQNADTLVTGVARSVRDEYSSWAMDTAVDRDFFLPVTGFCDSDREDGGRVLLETA